ncbi:MAG: hypothetical protein HDT01_05700 [Bacteroidales bacterium]|nr:hypothetical protein [Bacteroidales bacterium]
MKSSSIDIRDLYPYGVPMQSSTGAEVNRYKYGGKEFETERGLNHYDFEARTLIPQVAMFTVPDPKSGDYPSLNPYLYCAANPLKYIDPSGKDIYKVNEDGMIEETVIDKEKDAFIFVDSKGNPKSDSEGNPQILEFEYGTVIKYSQRHYAPFKRSSDEQISAGKADIIEVRGDDNATKLFEAFAQNVTAITENEVSLIRTGIEGDEGHDFISSGHVRGSEPGMTHLYSTQLKYFYNLREMIHGHPIADHASGVDIDVKNVITDLHLKVKTRIPQFKIYHVPTKTYIKY